MNLFVSLVLGYLLSEHQIWALWAVNSNHQRLIHQDCPSPVQSPRPLWGIPSDGKVGNNGKRVWRSDSQNDGENVKDSLQSGHILSNEYSEGM